MMKNKLLKLENNQSTKQVSTTMKDSRIVASNLIKNKLKIHLGICQVLRTQNTEHHFS